VLAEGIHLLNRANLQLRMQPWNRDNTAAGVRETPASRGGGGGGEGQIPGRLQFGFATLTF
jgi:hypothetical protein